MADFTTALNNVLTQLEALAASANAKDAVYLAKAVEALRGPVAVETVTDEGETQVNRIQAEGQAQIDAIIAAASAASSGATLLDKDVSQGDVTLTTSEIEYDIIRLTGSNAVPITVTLPQISSLTVLIDDRSAGSPLMTLSTGVAGGEGVTPTPGAWYMIGCDGTNVFSVAGGGGVTRAAVSERMKNFGMVAQAPDTDSVCLAQTTTGAALLNVDGSVADANGIATFAYPTRITITSGNNLSAVNVTVFGTDYEGAEIQETVAGPNNSTVSTVAFFKTVTDVQVSAAATSVSVGNGLAALPLVPSDGQAFKATLTHNVAFVPYFLPVDNVDRVITMMLIIDQDATGGHSFVLPENSKWPYGTAPTYDLNANGRSVVTLFSDDNGASFMLSFGGGEFS